MRPLVGRRGTDRIGLDRALLRDLPGPEGRPHGPDRIAKIRVDQGSFVLLDDVEREVHVAVALEAQ